MPADEAESDEVVELDAEGDLEQDELAEEEPPEAAAEETAGPTAAEKVELAEMRVEDEAADTHLTGTIDTPLPCSEQPSLTEAILGAAQRVRAVEASEADEATQPHDALTIDETFFGEEEALIEQPALAEESAGEAPAQAEVASESDETEAGRADARKEVPEASDMSPAPDEAVEPQAGAVELTAEEGIIEIVYEQLPATAEAAESDAAEPEADEEGGFDALLSNEQLMEGFEAEDDLLHGAAHTAELHAHAAPEGRNGNSVAAARNGNGTNGQSPEAHHARMR